MKYFMNIWIIFVSELILIAIYHLWISRHIITVNEKWLLIARNSGKKAFLAVGSNVKLFLARGKKIVGPSCSIWYLSYEVTWTGWQLPNQSPYTVGYRSVTLHTEHVNSMCLIWRWLTAIQFTQQRLLIFWLLQTNVDR